MIPQTVSISPATRAMLDDRNYVQPTDRIDWHCTEDCSKFIVRLHGHLGGNFGSRDANLWAEATPGSRKLKKKQVIAGDWYSLQASDFSVLRAMHTWDYAQMKFADAVTANLFAKIYTAWVAGDANAKRVADWNETGLPIDMPVAYKPEYLPNSYQTVAVCNGVYSEGFNLFMEQGTGKTYPTILIMAEAAIRARNAGQPFRAVVVAPNNVRLNWCREIEKFSPVPLATAIVAGEMHRRVQIMTNLFTATGPDYYGAVAVCSYEAAAEVLLILQHLQITVDIGVVDEAHTIKNPQADITKALHSVRPICRKRLALTGTPIGNSAFDLWGIMEWVYPGASGFTDFKSFKKYYAKELPRDASPIQKLRAMQNMPLLRERLARCAFIVDKKTALPYLPEKVFDVVSIKLTDRQRNVYNGLARELALSIEADLEGIADGKNRSVVINNVLTKSLKLTQVTSGYVKWDAEIHPVTGEELSPAWIEDFKQNPKLDWLIEEIRNTPGDVKFIVWAYQTHAQHLILAALAKAGIPAVHFNGETSDEKRRQAIDLFNDEELRTNPGAYNPETETKARVFVGHPKAAGAGTNLLGYPPGAPEVSPCNASRVVRYSYNYSAIDRSQSDDRSHRVGTRGTVRYSTLICTGTIERDIDEIVDAKRASASDLTNVRDILATIKAGVFND